MKRDQIPERYRWKLTDIYETDLLWEQDLKLLQNECEELASVQGKLCDANALLFALRCMDQLDERAIKLFAYARMRRDEDNTVPLYQGMTERVSIVLSDLGAKTSFLTPEIVAIGEDTVKEWCRDCEGLALYRQFFHDIFREAVHTLSKREEEILAMAGQATDAGGDVFDMYNNADIRFDKILDGDGKETQLTHGNYSVFLESADREVRRNAFLAMYCPYLEHQNMLAATLCANVKKNCFYAKVRGYSSAREMALSADAIDLAVYDNLIIATDENLPKLTDYLKLRKTVLGVEQLRMYDLYTPLVSEINRTYTFEEACDLVYASVAPLGRQYQTDLKHAFENGWIDVMENDGKTPGAYSWGSNSEHPFVLLNFHGTLDDVFTLAHEMGHAMHSFYTNNTQPSVYKNYKIFVAEVASTVNEALLMNHLLKIERDPGMRAYLLNHQLEGCRTTLYRQTMFAEFEREIHARYERGEALTAEWLMGYYRELNDKYFADVCTVDEEIAIEWARIPHFYSDFYVYQYATGYSAAQALCHGILSEGEPAVKRYLNFLSSGSSSYPLDLLADAGVDLRTPDPICAALENFDRARQELERLLVR